MGISRSWQWVTVFAAAFMAFSMVAVDHADARRGGSFGSRGARTFQTAPATRTAPQPAAPVERSMTPSNQNTASTRQAAPSAQQQRPGFLGGFGGTMMRGLLLGGLIGLLLGQGFGGLAGMFGLLLQVLLIGGLIMLAMRFFRSGSQTPAMAGAGSGFGVPPASPREAAGSDGLTPRIGSGAAPLASGSDDIELNQADLDVFERRLTEVQEAFGREDHAALRQFATPEIVSYLSEELADNAKRGVRNEVSEVKLLQADVAEAWSERDCDYATAAFRYESRDVTVDRSTGAVVDGNPDAVTETIELWTFARQPGGEWKLSAIQHA
ncbi:MAG: Tim44 domain-containing protein [Rhizobiaceae bacterium]|nr:Tim44 domain-containing protein [Rhizobiaceae bacterium]